MSDQPVVETIDLTKKYGEFTAVDRLNLRIEEGEIFGLLGPNGAGKTTTILMLLGLTEPSSGVARVGGYNPTREPLRVKRLAGYLPENVGFYDDMTGRQNLEFTADLNGLSKKEGDRRIDEALARVGLADVADKKVGKFSHGMRQRLGIAEVLIKKPKVVFLDEPTLGIDPKGVNELLELIVSMARDEKITVLLSSHQLHQVQQICHRVGIFYKGRLIVEGPIERLGRALGGHFVTVEIQATPNGSQLADRLRRVEGVDEVEHNGDYLLVKAARDIRPLLAREIVQDGGSLLHMRLRGYALEDIYLKYFREG